jgi:hypothetical protein
MPKDQVPQSGGALAIVVTIGFSTGVLVGGTTILLALCGLGSGYVVVICVAGIAIAPAILAFAPKLVSFRFRFGSASSAPAEAARRLAACASLPTRVKVEAYVSAHRRFDRCVLKSPCHLLRMPQPALRCDHLHAISNIVACDGIPLSPR